MPVNNTQRIGQSTANAATATQATNQELGGFFRSMAAHGAELSGRGTSGSYYLTVSAQPSAAQGPSKIKVDAGLARAILQAVQSGGRISQAETINKILPKITDASRYGGGEAVLARLLLSACDDRKVVTLNGKRINITNPAEGALNQGLASFWGELGAKARWGAADPGIEPQKPQAAHAPQMNSARPR